MRQHEVYKAVVIKCFLSPPPDLLEPAQTGIYPEVNQIKVKNIS